MALFPLALPKGVYRRGTAYQNKGRIYEANLIRWYGNAIGPIGGWVARVQDAVSGMARAIITWRDNAFSRWGAIGTHTKLYAFNSVPDIIDITPSGFVTGRADAAAKTGFGYGVFGAGLFGTARPDTGSSLPATVWDLDTFGEFLVGTADSDGRLFYWDLNVSNDAVVIPNAPTDCSGCFVTNERILVALGAGGNPRELDWSDIEDMEEWTASPTTKAGSFTLKTSGIIMSGRAVQDVNLILTDLDAWVMRYTGGVFVYGFQKVGEGCGALSRKAVCIAGNMAVWWGQGGFYIYDGAFRKIDCDVWEYVFEDLNFTQRSKITTFHNVEHGEVWWYYPSVGIEPSSYVSWKYPTANSPESIWNIGTGFIRTCAVEPGVFTDPIAVDEDGVAYDHETGSSYLGQIGTQQTPYFRTAPLEIGNGDRVARVTGIISDEETTGQGAIQNASVGFTNRMYPNGDDLNVSSVTLSSTGKTDVQFTARQVSMFVEFPQDNSCRWGTPRLMVQPGGRK